MKAISVFLSALPALAAGASASAAEPVKWAVAPSAGAIAEALLGKPAADGMAGRAQVRCHLAPSGALTGCAVVSEEPTGLGFGEAALAIVGKMRAAPAPDLPSEITLPIRFDPSPPLRPVAFPKVPGGYRNVAPVGPYYPDRAGRAGVTGYALGECHLIATGELKNCSALIEEPEGWGFSDVLLLMAKRGYVRAQPRTLNGQPIADEVVRVVVRYTINGRYP